VSASSGPMCSPAIPDDRAPRSLGSVGGSETKSINVTSFPHRTSSSSGAMIDLDPDLIKDMCEKVNNIDEKMNHIGTKEEYEKAKQDLVVEKRKNNELSTKIHDLQSEAKTSTQQMSKKDVDLSDMEQKCADLKVDLDRKSHKLSELQREVEDLQVKVEQKETKIVEQQREKENLNELQREHNCKVSDYIDKMVLTHNQKIEEKNELTGRMEEKDQKVRELTAQLKDEKQKKDVEIAKRRNTEQQMKETRAQATSLEEQMNDLKRVNEDSVKARDQAMKSLRNEQNKVKVIDEQKRELERERAVASEKFLEEKRQLESDNARLQERLKTTIKEFEQTKEEHANAISKALRNRSEEMVSMQNRLLEVEGQIESFKTDAEHAILQKDRAEQVLAEERQEFQISKQQLTQMKKELERIDTDRRRHSSYDKENHRLQETLKHQKSMIGDLESQLKQERTAANLLSPSEAARILKVRDDQLIHDNNELNIELCLVKDELQRLKRGPSNQIPQLEMQQTQSFAEPSSLVSTPANRTAEHLR